MKKKLITILAMLAIGATFVFAADQQIGATYSESMNASGDTKTTVVANALSQPIVFDLEAQTGSTWTNAQDEEVFDADWKVRSGFDAFFRLRATAGSYNSALQLTVNVSATNLYRDGETTTSAPNYHEAGAGSVSAATAGGNFTAGTFALNTGTLPILVSPNHVYGLNPTTGTNAADDSLEFTLSYAADANAPAGQYKSVVTVSYTNS
jgi:hypothetical protein